MEFLVTDGETFAHEEKRDLVTTFEYIDPEALGVRYVNRDPEGRYSLTKEIICDPHHAVVLTRVRLEGREDLLPRLKVYALLAPHLDGGGAGNSARAVDIAGHKALLAWKNEWSLVMTASCGFSRVSCGFVGASDGWQDLMQNFQMDWEFGSATNGNVAVMGEIDLGCDPAGNGLNGSNGADRRRSSERSRCGSSRWPSGLAKGITRRCRRRWARCRRLSRSSASASLSSGSGRRNPGMACGARRRMAAS